MNAEQTVREAITMALREHADLSAHVNGVHFGAHGRATAPHVVIGDLIAVDWGTKTAQGREIRSAVTIRDAAETSRRLEGLMAAAEAGIAGMERDLPGWRVASLTFIRSRIGRDGANGWIGVLEHRIRMLAA